MDKDKKTKEKPPLFDTIIFAIVFLLVGYCVLYLLSLWIDIHTILDILEALANG